MEPCIFLQSFPFIPPEILCRIHEAHLPADDSREIRDRAAGGFTFDPVPNDGSGPTPAEQKADFRK